LPGENICGGLEVRCYVSWGENARGEVGVYVAAEAAGVVTEAIRLGIGWDFDCGCVYRWHYGTDVDGCAAVRLAWAWM
jgi:hypothetical protein